jgi:hypothetical protein
MDWKEIAAKISSLAPVIGGAIGGPIGGLAGTAVSILAKAFGLPETSKAEDVLKSISGDPEWQLKVMVAENEFKLKIKELELMSTKAYLADVQSAREREKSVVQSTGKKDWNLYLTAWVVICGFFWLTYWLMTRSLPAGQNDVVFMLFGALSTGFGTVLAYFFGSSKGSAEKTELMAKK